MQFSPSLIHHDSHRYKMLSFHPGRGYSDLVYEHASGTHFLRDLTNWMNISDKIDIPEADISTKLYTNVFSHNQIFSKKLWIFLKKLGLEEYIIQIYTYTINNNLNILFCVRHLKNLLFLPCTVLRSSKNAFKSWWQIEKKNSFTHCW